MLNIVLNYYESAHLLIMIYRCCNYSSLSNHKPGNIIATPFRSFILSCLNRLKHRLSISIITNNVHVQSQKKKGSKHFTHMPDRSVIMFNVDKLVAEQNNGCFISGISGTRQVVFITLY